ncbi:MULTISPECIES: peptidylprolyl isomerase [Brevibacillus]|jgi:foldase protein PrsA|uniref:Foldase protein PrsA n=1 Tax=Brevibacillus borstelensis AK1 TaxID=1300222 RepID=M8E6J1_9BACL|nr:peptidylprolyl isomerase [Brevibacillus borstelensis]EMT51060.1 foldase protein PrsA precursor [Brevibacillus borstelensis AK1]KKX52778.1 foldase [Brevibacillus borstelensis cifa_chp40]MBE5395825.1 peptidylprolyl isomerase [Brevibacillus borstelensis]MCC0566195.1 peptidylprolyl isomerase [Brevibacillus borstelensis]MCM3560530.1 peptidylprolyl isomerase [Brevibacillus borstelensis]
MKRSVALLSSAVLAVSLLTGCGSAAEKDSAAKPADQTQQPANNGEQASQSDDVLDQFKKLTLPYSVDPKTAIVEYQGGELTAQEFETFLRVINFLNPMQGAMIESADQESLKIFAREYTATKILASRADAAMEKESQELAEKTFENLKGQYLGLLGKDESKFAKLMEKEAIDKDTVVKQMALINNSMAVLRKGIDDAKLKKEYEGLDKESITVASVRHILVSFEKHNNNQEEALKVANDLLARLKKGEDFAKLAKENTDDPGSQETGGLYENADVSQWVPEFKEAALKLPLNQISDPVKTSYGYHIMKVESRKERTFEEMKPELQNKMLEQEYDKFNKEELDKLITKYNIPQPKPAS